MQNRGHNDIDRECWHEESPESTQNMRVQHVAGMTSLRGRSVPAIIVGAGLGKGRLIILCLLFACEP